jgi:uncharacterized protein (DUF983 family)
MSIKIEKGHELAEHIAPPRPLAQALLRGLQKRCPGCGRGRLFYRYLKNVDCCETCGEELHHHRADDAPPYFTMLIAGHVIVPLILSVEFALHPPLLLQMTLWPALALVLILWMLGPIKGALIAFQWAMRMHGFGPDAGDELDPLPPHDDLTSASRGH